ncbi:zf-HC2 domain-containing protein [Calidifontibacter indicus]|uniref:Putative zinc finger protein n=1 Tax=Calidifontibacter indicus TaxID=419650 RepID=A0A3D9UTR8_9MICO|nr:zf-HC2 domain-containing protein [Calidifontibacter indicus]REF31923.1 putative zinc finger protein [Calidifontibacter indicus]
MTWHVETPVWEAYAAGRLDPAAEASVETHLTGCSVCRSAAATLAPDLAPAVWADVRTAISERALPWPLRVLRRLGARDDDLVVVSAADSLLVPWAMAVGLSVVCACVVGLAGLGAQNRDAAFLALAPLIPVLAVAASFDALDPVRELTAPTPYSKLRMALLRASAALSVALPATLAVGLLVPHMSDLAFVWLTPSLGLTVAALVLLTWFEARVAGGLVATGWVACVMALRSGGDLATLTSPAVQAAFVVGGALLAVTLVLRTSTLRIQGGDL